MDIDSAHLTRIQKVQGQILAGSHVRFWLQHQLCKFQTLIEQALGSSTRTNYFYFHVTHDSLLIDFMQLTSSPHVTERETVSGQKSEYYATILSGKNDRGLHVSTAEQFASSFLTSAGSDFTFAPRMRNASTGPNAH